MINFFDAVHLADHSGHGGAAGQATDKFFSFDVTELFKRLHLNKQLRAKPTLTIVPAGQPASAAKPVIGEISLVEQ